MPPHSANPNRPHRRDFLKTGAAVGLGLATGRPAVAAPGRAKSCIFLMLTGGPSHIDTWDPKPDAPAEIRGPFRPISTRVPGMFVSELFPKMAAMADKFSLIRGLHHTAAPIHENGFQLLNTGRLFRDGPEWPSVGAVVSHLTRRKHHVVNDPWLETGVNISHGQGAGWLGNQPSTGIQSTVLSLFAVNCECAAAAVVRDAACFATVNMYQTVFDAVSWDCHAAGGSLATDLGDYRDTVAPMFDSAFTALLTNLESHGLLDSTLVVAVGEFGRTPKLNANGGRDHWPGCWTAVVAGGGVRGGRVVGASDKIGAEPADRPVTCPELVATIYHALGIPADTRIPGPDGTPVPVVEADPVLELF